jgi:NAD(P)H-dependent FMN reductase
VSERALRIGVILASVRQGRRGEKFARWILGLVRERTEVDVELLDLRDYAIGAYSHEAMVTQIENAHPDETTRKWAERIRGLDGYVIVTPEYNHGYPGNLKNALDQVHTGWWYKPVGFVSYGGSAGGARAVEQLRSVAVELRMVPVRGEVNLRLIGLELDEEGRPKDGFYAGRAKGMIDQVVWWARASREARKVEEPPAG